MHQSGAASKPDVNQPGGQGGFDHRSGRIKQNLELAEYLLH
jgi:hypothetical protein